MVGSDIAVGHHRARLVRHLPVDRHALGRQFQYRRDKRLDCVQVVIALIVTPDGFPLAYEVMPGNTADDTTLAAFLEKIERQYGRSDRIWIMDRGIPTEETLASMRDGDAPVRYPDFRNSARVSANLTIFRSGKRRVSGLRFSRTACSADLPP